MKLYRTKVFEQQNIATSERKLKCDYFTNKNVNGVHLYSAIFTLIFLRKTSSINF